MIIITIIYFAHEEAHYDDVDRMLENISTHVHEEIWDQLYEGKALENVHITIDDLSINEIGIMVKNKRGETVDTNYHPFFKNHELLSTNQIANPKNLETIIDKNGTRIRVKTEPIHQNNRLVGYIETFYSLNNLDLTLQRFKWTVLGLTIMGIFLASLAGWFLAKKTLRRVDLIGGTANAIASSQDFKQRVLHLGPRDELGKLTETFNQMLDSLEKVYNNQKRFLSDASHELRAPLTTIRGNLDILHKIKQIPEKDRDEILADSRNEAIRMSKLVSDLLALARADAGQKIHMEVISLSILAESVLAGLESWEKEVKVETMIKDGIKVWGDSDQLKQLLIILLDNALKYTNPNMAVFVTITEDNEQAVIRVRDTGIGIEKEEINMIFERFYRTDSARRHSPDGTGLGLAIAKSIVDKHHGSILVTSKPGEGTEFVISLSMIKE